MLRHLFPDSLISKPKNEETTMGSRPEHPQALLTPADVAELLQIDVKTVYKHQRRLCGFHPAGIRCLRFRREVIYDIMEHSARVAAPIIDWHKEIEGSFRDKAVGSCRGKGKIKNRTDPSRHGL